LGFLISAPWTTTRTTRTAAVQHPGHRANAASQRGSLPAAPQRGDHGARYVSPYDIF